MPLLFNQKLTAGLAWVIIDANVDDHHTLIDGVAENTNVFVLDANQDGIEQITELFRTAALPPQSLHLITHGAPGTLYLGNTELGLRNLQDYAQLLSTWKIEHLLLYGCNVAAGDAGEEFITKLSALTGASLAASTTRVGSAKLGGNWQLDATTHNQSVELAIQPCAMANYRGVLVTLPDVSEIFTFNGQALRQDEDEIFLVPNEGNENGSAFSSTRIDFNLNWDFTFELSFGDDDAGADGIGFVLHNDPRGEGAIGSAGSGLGIAGVQNSIAIEFDTFQNTALGDPAADHTAIILDPESNILSHTKPGNEFTAFESNIEDGNTHLVVVRWDATTETLSYTFDGVDSGSVTRDVVDLDFAGEDLIFWGFGASTGGRANEHQVRLIDFNGRLVDESGDDIINSPSEPPGPTPEPPVPPSPVPLPPGVDPVSGVSVFQFEQFVQFEEIDEDRSYAGDDARFNEEIYLAFYRDIRAAVEAGEFSSGREHYRLLGANAGRSTLPLNFKIGGLRMASFLDETFYLNQNQDVAAAVINGDFTYGFEHLIKHGIREGRNPSYYYNEQLYLNTYADVRAAVELGEFNSGLEHYLNFGHIENRTASTLFDPGDYLLNNTDVSVAVQDGRFVSGLHHYLEHGAEEGRISTLLYEEFFYLRENPDVAAAVSAGDFKTGFEHYVTFGQKEGRNPGPLFDESLYLDSNPDVAAAVGTTEFSSGMEQFFRHGRDAGRPALVNA